MNVRAALSSAAIHAEPGAEGAATLTVRNAGDVVDHFRIEVLGDAARWAVIEPEVMPLFPGTEGQVRIAFRPARSSAALAGQVPFGVKVTSTVDPTASTVEEGSLEIGAFNDLSAELIPQTSHGVRTGRHEIACDNRGNVPLTLGFSGLDPEEKIRFGFSPSSTTAAPGTATFVRMRARPRKRFLSGQPKTLRYQVLVQSREAPPVSLDGTMVQHPYVPAWAPKALLAVAVLAAALVALWYGLLRPTISSEAQSAAQKAVAQTLGGSGAPGGGSSKSSTATPSNATPPPPSGSQVQAEGARLTATAPQNGSSSLSGQSVYLIPAGHNFALTDIIMENPNGDTGNLYVERSGTAIFVEQLSNFRDLDFHFVTPIVFQAGQALAVSVSPCTQPGPAPPATPGPTCSDSIVFSGTLAPSS
ncbi:MAG: hypothetical protein WCB85_10685 [Candidatus Dormiibacterota bacterium]